MEKDKDQLDREKAELSSKNKQAQDSIDAILAEIDRLKTVAIDLNESNKANELAFNKEKTIRAAEIKALEDDTNTALVNKKEAVAGFEIELAKKSDIENAIKTLKEKAQDIETEIFVKGTTLETLNTSLNTVSKDIQNQKDTHAALMRSNEQEVLRFTEASNKQKNETAVSMQLAKAALEIEKGMVLAAKKDLDKLLKQIEQGSYELSLVEENRVKTLAGLDYAKSTLADTTEQLEAEKSLLASVKKEVETVQAELKPLIAKRIASVTFMEELNNRENILRKKYEDVGLEY